MTLRLAVDGKVYVGWIRATITRSLDSFAHIFSLSYLDTWSSEQEPWTIVAGEQCILSWDAHTLIAGYVNKPRMRVAETDWQLHAEGRSLTGDLVDSSAVHETGVFRNQTAFQIASALCEPFGIKVSTNAIAPLEGANEPFKRFAVQEGETVHRAIDRACKMRALLPRTLEDGTVQLYTADVFEPALGELPVTSALSREYVDDDSMRFSEYLTSSTGIGSQEDAITRGEAKDSGIKRFRPLVVVGDAPAKINQAQLRAQWEANVRYGRGEMLTYEFQDVLGPSGVPYAPGQRYRVRDEAFGIDLVMLVRSATLTVSADQLVTRVELVRVSSYSRFPFTQKRLTKRTKRPKKVRTKRPNL